MKKSTARSIVNGVYFILITIVTYVTYNKINPKVGERYSSPFIRDMIAGGIVGVILTPFVIGQQLVKMSLANDDNEDE